MFAPVHGARSWVWEYFLRNAEHDKAQCKLCASVLKISSGSTKGLSDHLNKKHSISKETEPEPKRYKIDQFLSKKPVFFFNILITFFLLKSPLSKMITLLLYAE